MQLVMTRMLQNPIKIPAAVDSTFYQTRPKTDSSEKDGDKAQADVDQEKREKVCCEDQSRSDHPGDEEVQASHDEGRERRGSTAGSHELPGDDGCCDEGERGLPDQDVHEEIHTSSKTPVGQPTPFSN